MGAQITVKVPKGKDVNAIIQQLRQALTSAGMKNIDFNVRQNMRADKYNKPNLELDSHTLKLL